MTENDHLLGRMQQQLENLTKTLDIHATASKEHRAMVYTKLEEQTLQISHIGRSVDDLNKWREKDVTPRLDGLREIKARSKGAWMVIVAFFTLTAGGLAWAAKAVLAKLGLI